MKLTRRRDEIARMVAILDSDDYDTSEAMAWALLNEAVEIVTNRDLYAVVPQGAPCGFGPYATDTEATRAWDKQVGPVAGQNGGYLLPIRPFPPEPVVEGGGCRECGHPEWLHVANKNGKPTDCAFGYSRSNKKGSCSCRSFTRR